MISGRCHRYLANFNTASASVEMHAEVLTQNKDMNMKIYHYPQHWARTCQYRVYVDNRYVAGCHGETYDEALNKYYDQLKDVPFPDAVKLPEPSNPPKEDESYLPLAIMITISGFAALYVGYRLWRHFL